MMGSPKTVFPRRLPAKETDAGLSEPPASRSSARTNRHQNKGSGMSYRNIAFCGILCVFLLGACMSATDTNEQVVTGLVDAVEVDVASKIPGRLSKLLVKEGDKVKKGQKLVTIESEEILAKMDQVQASIDAVRSKLSMARKGARKEEKEAVRKQLEAARHQVEITRKTYERMLKLRDSGAFPQAKFDEVEFKYNVSKDQMAMAEAKYDLVMKGARKEEIEALEALVKQGESTLDEVQSYQKETTQYAPIAGEVSKIVLHEGELAATGYPILTLVDMQDLWVVFAVREDWLADISKGDTINVHIPALRRDVELTIFNIAAMGDFATWRATNDKNSFDLKSFEIKARPTAAVEKLRPGMTVRWTWGR